MNKSPLAKVLLVILAVISIWSLLLCWKYFGKSRQLREKQMQINQVNFRQQVFGMMLNDAAEYSRHSVAMSNLLVSLSTPPPSVPANPAPSGLKPPGK